MSLLPTDKRPHDFERVFIQQGWRGIEYIFGARTPVNKRWVLECGGVDALQIRRRKYRGCQSLPEADQ